MWTEGCTRGRGREDATGRHHPAAQQTVAYLGDLIHARRRLRLWGALLAGLAVLAEAGATPVDTAIAFPVGELDAPTSVSHCQEGTGRKPRDMSLRRPLGFSWERRAWRALRSKAALRRGCWRRRGARQLLNKQSCLVGVSVSCAGAGRGRLACWCVVGEWQWLSSVAAMRRERAGAMLKSEGRRCSAAGDLARMEWSFTCTSAGQHSSWLLGGLQFANCSVSYVSTSACKCPALPWRGLRPPSTPRPQRRHGPFGRGARSAGFALALR